MANGTFMVQGVYPKHDVDLKTPFIGIFDTLTQANAEYIKAAPNNTTIR